MDADLDTLATALYVTCDDFLTDNPQHRPWRPRTGLIPRLEDAELITLVVLQALLGFTSEARWLRYADTHLRGLFPYLPTQSGYNKRVRAATGTLRAVIAHLVACTTRSSDDVWVVDSTPVECGRSRETAKRSDLAGWAEYGYCASHSRFFWGLRLHLLCTLSGLPVAFALTGAKADERETLLAMFDADPALMAGHRDQVLIADKNCYGTAFEADLAAAGVELLRPARNGEKPRAGQRFFNPLRQVIESINNTLEAQLDLEHHGGRTVTGVASRVLQRILALTAAIWHNDQTGQPIAIINRLRPLTPWNYSSSRAGLLQLPQDVTRRGQQQRLAGPPHHPARSSRSSTWPPWPHLTSSSALSSISVIGDEAAPPGNPSATPIFRPARVRTWPLDG